MLVQSNIDILSPYIANYCVHGTAVKYSEIATSNITSNVEPYCNHLKILYTRVRLYVDSA